MTVVCASCGQVGGVSVGPNPASLMFWVVPGHSWAWSASITEKNADGTTTQIAWPSAPSFVIDIDPEFTLTATLEEDTETSLADGLAVWSMTAEQVAAIPKGATVQWLLGDDVLAKGWTGWR